MYILLILVSYQRLCYKFHQLILILTTKGIDEILLIIFLINANLNFLFLEK